MRGALRRAWWARAVVLAAVVAAGHVVLTLLDYDPRPLGWALLATTITALLWLVLDATGTRAAGWDAGLPPFVRPDASEDTAHSRVLDGHLDSREPGPALRDRLVALARSRDPDLADPGLRELASQPVRRLTPDEIDRHLTRIEALRERRST